MKQYTIIEAGVEGNGQYLILLLNTSNSLSGKRLRIYTPNGTPTGVGSWITSWLPVLADQPYSFTTYYDQYGQVTSSPTYVNMLGQIVPNQASNTTYRIVGVQRPPIAGIGADGTQVSVLRGKNIKAEQIYSPLLFPASRSRSARLPFSLTQVAQKMLLPVRRTM